MKTKGTEAQVLELLLRQGPMTVKEIQRALGLSSSAVRLHLEHLLHKGLLTYEEKRRGVGRPVRVYMLTPKARAAMASPDESLALSLLEEVVESEGPEKARQLLGRVSTRLAREYKRRLHSTHLPRRLQELHELLRQRGVVADIQQQGDTLYIYEYTCPYHDVAQEHRLVCEMEESFLREVLGTPVTLSSCMMDGAHKCVFEISMNSKSQ